MGRPEDDPRELLRGLIALENHFIDEPTLREVLDECSRAPGRSMTEILVERGALDDTRSTLLEGLLQEHLKRHGGDAGRCLAARGLGRTLLLQVAQGDEAGATASLAHAGSTTLDDEAEAALDANRTVTFALRATPESQRFHVLRPHARGGLGAVFVALDRELHREVALKQIQERHADDPGSRSRFLLEAEITGGLEHPGIVPVYSLGKDSLGRPYYAMRFIRGESLKKAIAQFHANEELKQNPGARGLELQKLLRRFLDVCNAVEYAHQRGVLHRDLKPGNVMMGRYGETLVVDWGLAKVVGRAEPQSPAAERALVISSASGTAETLPGSALGTPAYMSPEQAAGRTELLSPASDVYSLGATLYCLLVGKPPFADLPGGEILQAVERGEFAPPRKLDPSIPPALEAICLKAMALEPAKRYATPCALGDEIERWMADEPVHAYPEPLPDRLRRWSRRHRAVVASGAMLLATAAAALAVNDWMVRKEQQRTKKALIDSQVNFDLARSTVEHMLVSVNNAKLPTLPGAEDLRRTVAERTVALYEQFLKRMPADRPVRDEAARVYTLAGTILRQTNRFDQARHAYDRALELLENLSKEDRGKNQYLRDRLAEAYIEYGILCRLEGRLPEGEPYFLRALKESRALQDESPDFPNARRTEARALYGLSKVYRETGRPGEALKAAQQSIAIQKDLPELPQWRELDPLEKLFAGSHLAPAYRALHRPAQAETAARAHVEAARKYLSGDESNNNRRFLLANALEDLGLVIADQVETRDEAESAFSEAIGLVEPLTADFPLLPLYRNGLATMQIERAALRSDRGEAQSAQADAEAARDTLASLLNKSGGLPAYRGPLARAQAILAHLALARGDREEAKRLLEEAVTNNTTALRANPRSPEDLACKDLIDKDLKALKSNP